MAAETRGVNWEFAICKVITEIGFVQGKASPCIYRHFERQLRVWVVLILSTPRLRAKHSCAGKNCGMD